MEVVVGENKQIIRWYVGMSIKKEHKNREEERA